MAVQGSGDIPFVIQRRATVDGPMEYYNGNTGERITAEEAERLSKGLGGDPAPVGDTTPKRTPQAGEQVKIVKKDMRGRHYYVYDELGNTYEVDNKTYNSLKKGKGFVDGGQLSPVSEGAPQPIKKKIDVQKGEQSQVRREVRTAVTEAENAITSQQTVEAKKAELKEQYKTAQKEMKEARKALTEAIEKPGADTTSAARKYNTARSKFKSISREYKAICRQLDSAIGRTTRAITTLENAQKRSKAITAERDAAKAAERKAQTEYEQKKAAQKAAKDPETQARKATEEVRRLEGKPVDGKPAVEPKPVVAEAEGAVEKAATKVENTAANAEKAASKVKGGGKWKWLAIGAAALIGLGATLFFTSKSEEGEETHNTASTGDTVSDVGDGTDTDTDTETSGSGAVTAEEVETDTIAAPATPSQEEIAAAQAENDADLAQVETDEAEANAPIVVKPGDNLWNICKAELKRKNSTDPSNKEIAEAVGRMMEANGLHYEADGYVVLIYADQELQNTI